MKHITGLMLFFSLTVLLTGLSYAAHPLITDDTGTQGRGHFQLEVNGEYGHDKEDGIKTETLDIKTILSYGLIDAIDIVLTIPYQGIRVRSEDPREDNDGIGDISFELKWRFYEKDGLSLAFKPGLTLPSGNEDRGLGTGRATYSLFFITSYESLPWSVHFNGGYIRNENRLKERKDIWHISIAGLFEVSEQLKAVGNVGMERSTEKSSNTAPAFLIAGIIYSLSKDLDLDMGVKAGLNKIETDYSVLAGMTWRF